MRRQDICNSFDFNDQLPIHENIRAKPFVELDAFIGNRNSGLPFESDPSLLQLMAQAAFINRFQHAGSGQPMHLDGQPDDSLGQFAREQHSVMPPCRSVVLRALRVIPARVVIDSRRHATRPCVMAGGGRPPTTLPRATKESRGWPAFAGHDTERACHVGRTSVVSRVRIKCLTLRNPEPREPSDKPPDTTGAGADAILGGRGRWDLSRDQPAKSTTQSTRNAIVRLVVWAAKPIVVSAEPESHHSEPAASKC